MLLFIARDPRHERFFDFGGLKDYIELKLSQKIETGALAQDGFRLDQWLVEPMPRRLTHGEVSVKTELKVMDVLVYLAQHAGCVVTRKEIIDAVWATEYVSENTLTHAISILRSALGDDPKDPVYIETIHRRGYRLVARVTLLKKVYCPLVGMATMDEA